MLGISFYISTINLSVLLSGKSKSLQMDGWMDAKKSKGEDEQG